MTAVRAVGRGGAWATSLTMTVGWLASPVHAQVTPLERWTVAYVADGWSPRWRGTELETWAAERGRVSIRIGGEVLSLGAALRQSTTSLEVALRQPVGRSLAVTASAASGARRTETGGRVLTDSPRGDAGAVGIEMTEELDGIGRLRLGLDAGWDGGAGGAGHLRLGSERYRLHVAGWRTVSRGAYVYFPADSLREVGVGQLVTGVSLATSVALEVGGVSVAPTVRYAAESIHERLGEAPAGFLRSSPFGDARLYEVGLRMTLGSWLVGGGYRHRRVDVEGLLHHGERSAGRLFFTDLEYGRWIARVGLVRGTARWSVEVADGRSDGRLSTRVETWPFVDVWEQLVAQAYRLRGSLEARVLSMSIRRRSLHDAGWSGALTLARYRVRTVRDSWFVTAFGFGRADRVTTLSGADPAILVGAETGRTVPLAGGVAHLRLEVGVPVYSDEPVSGGDGGGSAGDGLPGDGLPGYLAVSVGWRR